MSTSSNNPFGSDPQEKGPWLYSGGPQPTYVPPATPQTPPPAPPTSPASAAAAPASQTRAAATSPAVPSTPATPKAPAPPPKSDDASLASIVDTIEAIIIALILALTFRAFVVEAFVIPTGSMAPTLLGAHFNVICPKCGYAFKRDGNPIFEYAWNPQMGRYEVVQVKEHAELTSNRTVLSDVDAPIICPNCQYAIDPGEFPQRLPPVTAYDFRNMAMGPISLAWDNNGDRILVLKYLYAVMEPSRFDVIVFKEPMFARDNFIKRLIGLPGETIELVNGDVYIGAPGHTNPDELFIARKPPHIQKAVWQLVYDNDYYPTDAGKPRIDGSTWQNPWSGAGDTATQWSIAGPVFSYEAAAPGMMQFDVTEPHTFNVLGYNNDTRDLMTNKNNARGTYLVRVGDLRVETVWTPKDATGTSIKLTAGQPLNEYQVVWDKDGLDMQQFNPTTQAFSSVQKAAYPAPEAGKSYHVALDNVDHSVRVFIDDKLVMVRDNPWTAQNALAEMHRHQDEALTSANKPEIRIAVGGACRLGRDLYYTQSSPGYPRHANAGEPLTLNADEFFAMGDNSYRSLDGRMWNALYPALDDLGTREGIVPRRYLLGKAFFVYWPAGYRITSDDNVPFFSNVPLVPNTGEMRLIR
jgi:signal peptidase I